VVGYLWLRARTGKEGVEIGRTRTRNLVGQDKDREVA